MIQKGRLGHRRSQFRSRRGHLSGWLTTNYLGGEKKGEEYTKAVVRPFANISFFVANITPLSRNGTRGWDSCSFQAEAIGQNSK